MAEQEKQELARRAVACKHWRWLPGMLAPLYGRIYAASNAGAEPMVLTVHTGQGGRDSAGVATPAALIGPPDLDDPATLGCLLALVREAWGESFNNYSWNDRGLAVTVTASGAGNVPEILEGVSQFYGEPAEALVAALEAAP